MGLFYLLIGVLLLFAGWMALRWFTQAEPKQLLTAGKWTAVAVGGAVALWLVVTGRVGQAIMLASVLAPFFVRWKSLWTRMSNAGGPTLGGSSDIETQWLRMSLDHDTGAMDGIVLKGARRGRGLRDLPLETLRELYIDCRVEDPDSAALLEAYLDRVHPEWRGEGAEAQTQANAAPASSGAMSRDEALNLLGLKAGASETEIRDAHRRLMKLVHPDRGGSPYLAAKINQAKDFLLGK
jgi:hypothetical protein